MKCYPAAPISTPPPKALNPATATTAPSAMNLVVDGKRVAVEAYTIGNSNYIKVRDMAYLVNGTGKNFGVTWNNEKSAVELKSRTAYSPVAGDMGKGDGAEKTAARASSATYVDGVQRRLTAYSIGANNFFKLRDVMRMFDVSVGYDGSTVTLDSAKGCEQPAEEQRSVSPPSTKTVAPPAAQVNKLEITKNPSLEFYMTGKHTFSTVGWELRYLDENGVAHKRLQAPAR